MARRNSIMDVMTITGKRQAAVADAPMPKAAKSFALVKIHTAPMCTEYKAYTAGTPTQRLGHEAAGEVVEIASPGSVGVGDRVVVMPLYPCGRCRYCTAGEYIHCENSVDALVETGSESGTATYAQYLVKQDWLLLPIPDDLSYDEASMACCGLGPTFGAMELMGVGAFDTLLVSGLGPVGLGGVINGTFRGARVIALEPNPYRADLGMALGAAAVLDPADPETLRTIRELTGGVGADAAVDCTGVAAAQRLLIDGVRRKGQVSLVGEGGALEILTSADMIRKGLTIRGSWHYNLSGYPKVVQVIRGAREKINTVITHRFPLRAAAQAWELQLTGRCGKVLLHPWDTNGSHA